MLALGLDQCLYHTDVGTEARRASDLLRLSGSHSNSGADSRSVSLAFLPKMTLPQGSCRQNIPGHVGGGAQCLRSGVQADPRPYKEDLLAGAAPAPGGVQADSGYLLRGSF